MWRAGERVDGDVDAVAAHPQGGAAAFGHGDDRFGTQVVGGEQRAHGDGLVDARKLHAGEIGVQLDVFGPFGGGANVGHFNDGFQRELAGGGLCRQHHGVGAIQHGVGHVAHLGAGGHGVGNHALHHLRGSDGGFVMLACQFDHALLQGGHGGVADLDRQVAARDHDAVAGEQDFQQFRDRFGAFDFGDQMRFVAELSTGHIGELARQFHIEPHLGKLTAR